MDAKEFVQQFVIARSQPEYRIRETVVKEAFAFYDAIEYELALRKQSRLRSTDQLG